MILVCGGLADSLTELMIARLADCGYDHQFLDLGIYPKGYKVKWYWKNSLVEGYIAGPGWRLDLDELTGVYVRYPGQEARVPPEGIGDEVAATMFFEYDTGLMSLFEDLPCPVINRSGGGMSNGSKPYQGLIVRESGLLTPPTLVTNDPQSAFQFYKKNNGEVIYKSLSGIRSIVRRMGPEQINRLDFLRNGPAQFQAFIPGKNIRVHTIGTQVFSTIVHSEAVDYRYARREGHEVNMEAITLPPSIEQACLRLAKKLDLLLAGIDLKLTPAGKYYCFEINPSPAFLYYEINAGQPISKAVAELLHTGKGTELHHKNNFALSS